MMSWGRLLTKRRIANSVDSNQNAPLGKLVLFFILNI